MLLSDLFFHRTAPLFWNGLHTQLSANTYDRHTRFVYPPDVGSRWNLLCRPISYRHSALSHTTWPLTLYFYPPAVGSRWTDVQTATARYSGQQSPFCILSHLFCKYSFLHYVKSYSIAGITFIILNGILLSIFAGILVFSFLTGTLNFSLLTLVFSFRHFFLNACSLFKTLLLWLSILWTASLHDLQNLAVRT